MSFQLHKGEILGFGGLSECGMHEVGKAIFGAAYGRGGTVALADGTKIKSIPKAIRSSIAYASKDRDNESVVLGDTIRDNVCLLSLDDLANHGILSSKKMDAFAVKYAERMSVKMTGVRSSLLAPICWRSDPLSRRTDPALRCILWASETGSPRPAWCLRGRRERASSSLWLTWADGCG